MFCTYEVDICCTHVCHVVFDLSVYACFRVNLSNFSLCSPMNQLIKTNRTLWVFQLNIHGGNVPSPSGGALQMKRLEVIFSLSITVVI